MFDLEEEKYTFPNNKEEVDKFVFETDVFMFVIIAIFLSALSYAVCLSVNWLISYGYLKG